MAPGCCAGAASLCDLISTGGFLRYENRAQTGHALDVMLAG